jgi:nitrogenase molybdenum-iron protein alpha/beta subunit
MEFPGPPVGFPAVAFLAKALSLALPPDASRESASAAFLEAEARQAELLLRGLDDWRGELLGLPVALVGDESAVAPIASFLRREFGVLAELAIITDDSEAFSYPDENSDEDEDSPASLEASSEAHPEAAPEASPKSLSPAASSSPSEAASPSWASLAARVVRTGKEAAISRLLKEAEPLVILGSSLEAKAAEEIGASLLEISYPSRQISLSRSYAGLRGAVTLAEDFTAKALSALEARDASLASKLRGL